MTTAVSWTRECVRPYGSLYVWGIGKRGRSRENLLRGWKSGSMLASSPGTWWGRVVARPDPEPYCVPVKPDFVFGRVSISPGTCLIVFLLSLPFPRPLGLPAGLTLTTLPSDRAAWIRLPAGLATCRWSTLRWGSTPSSLKTRSLFCGRNTETSSDFEEPGRVGGGEQEGPEDGVSGSLFPVHIRSAAELDCAKYPNKLRWSKWQKKEYKGK